MKYIIILLLLILSLSFFTSCAEEEMEITSWAKYFEEAGVDGCGILKYSVQEKVILFNPKRVSSRFTPGRNFNILNILFAIDRGVIHKLDDTLHVLRDDLLREPIQMDTAYNTNNRLFFIELAARIGAGNMQAAIKSIDYYGTMQTIGDLDRFWWDSSLIVSAREEMQFMEELANSKLPFQKESQLLVGDLMLDSTFKNEIAHTIYSLTAFCREDSISRYTGYIDAPKNKIYFAFNIDTKENMNNDSLLKSIVRNVFIKQKIIDLKIKN